MGLNYKYMLYFHKDQLWEVLKGLSDLCDREGMKPTTIQFPDHDLMIPLMSSWGEEDVIPYNKPKFELAISMNFKEDDAILDYLHNRDGDPIDRSPPEDGQDNIYSIGFIYLTVYADLSQHFAFKKPTDLCLFEFGTTGTQMSLLFSESTSIRDSFVGLLEHFQGLIGIFDREIDYSELFWFKGKQMDITLYNNYMTPQEIEDMLIQGE